jgi:lipopolysaccharide heptosyltransferase II
MKNEGDAMKTPWEKAKKILAVRLDALGDVLMTTPALRALRGRGGRRVTLLTSPAGAEAARAVPEVDDVLTYEAPWMKASGAGNPRAELDMIAALARRKFDAAVIFTVYSQSPLPAALLCRMAGIPLRLAHCHENPYQLLTDWVPDPEPDQKIRHEVRRQLDLVETVGFHTERENLSLRIPEETRTRCRAAMEKEMDLRRPWVLIHPGASAPSRRYSPQGFAEAADILARDHGRQILFTGSAAEAPLIEGIRAAMSSPSVSWAGRLDFMDLAAVISLAPVLIVNNTGPAHIAAAVGTPLVDIYAMTNPQHTPWKVPHRLMYSDVPCRFCYKSVCPETHHACLKQVTPASVADAAVSLSAEGSPCTPSA